MLYAGNLEHFSLKEQSGFEKKSFRASLTLAAPKAI